MDALRIGRRGFLKTMAAALVGTAATFDPQSLLWVPAPKPIELATVLPTAGAASVDETVARLLELDDLALEFARTLGERLLKAGRYPPMMLREVVFQAPGVVRRPPNAIEIEDAGVGLLEAGPRRTTTLLATASRAQVAGAAREFAVDNTWDLFVPVGRELRPGEPFTPDVEVGVATDPATGLTARAMRYRQAAAPRRRRSLRAEFIDFEIAGGQWRPAHEGARARRRRAERQGV